MVLLYAQRTGPELAPTVLLKSSHETLASGPNQTTLSQMYNAPLDLFDDLKANADRQVIGLDFRQV